MKEEEYRTLIQAMDRPALRKLWRDHIVKGEPPAGWAKGKPFEYLVIRAFELDLSPAAVKYPFEVRDAGLGTPNKTLEQLDGSIECDGVHWLVQSKNYKDGLDAVPILELRQRLQRRPAAVMGMIFSARKGFTEPATRLLAMLSPLRILLWDHDDLREGLDARGRMVDILRKKWREAIWYADPYSPRDPDLEEA